MSGKQREGRLGLVSVGDEVLSGRVVDTNASLLARELESGGWTTTFRCVVGDDVWRIAEVIEAGFVEAEVLILCGGLGPTRDDLTREGVARAFGVALRPDPRALELVEKSLRRGAPGLTEANRIQALLPESATPVPNPVGTAPGFHIRDARGAVIVLPGVPSELAAMVPAVASLLHAWRPGLPRIVRDSVVIASLPESEIGRRIADLMARDRAVRVGSYPQAGFVRLVAETSDADEGRARSLVRAVLDEVRARFGSTCLEPGTDDPASAVLAALERASWKLGLAESITGGRIGDRLVAIPGASAVFQGSLVTYSDASKTAVLGVPAEVLREHGAVSAACASAMAEGAMRVLGADCALSVTGIAGPAGARPGKPIGLVHFGWASRERTETESRIFAGDREWVRTRAAALALDLVRRRLACLR